MNAYLRGFVFWLIGTLAFSFAFDGSRVGAALACWFLGMGAVAFAEHLKS